MLESNPPILNMPLLALRGIFVFPKTSVHFDVIRKKSIEALNVAMASNRNIFLLTQKDISVEDPSDKDLYTVGTVAKIKQILRLSNDTVRVLVEGVYRAKLINITANAPCFYANLVKLQDEPLKCRPVYRDAMLRNAKNAFDEYARIAPKMPPDVLMSVVAAEDMGYLADFITNSIQVEPDDKQYILEQTNTLKRLKLVITLLKREKELLLIDAKISDKVRARIDENQREYYLREQIKAIKEELNGDSEEGGEYDKYYKRIAVLSADESVKKRLTDEADKLVNMPQGSHEATVVVNYLETCLSLPWNVNIEAKKINFDNAKKILDRDHYGLQKVKERILELLAVRALSKDVKGQIICLVGPPGVGKTSIARSVAECLGRKYARISLGGVTDESEIRGHRKTYIGAMPGRIINAFKVAGSSNPVILLDEIDKLGSSYKGDPSSAMLEILDSEQNNTFHDHYVDMPFDLSKALFITTANDAGNIPAPLLDRMELIEISSYTRDEKYHIAKNHLVKKQLKENGLIGKKVTFTDDAIFKIIDSYTKEAGVRRLDRVIASLCRKAAAKVVSGAKSVKITESLVKELLGTEKYKPDNLTKTDEVGIVNGLAWTSVGGEIMQLEVAVVKGSGKLELTGSLGDVMQESAKAAVTCLRSRSEVLGIEDDFYKKYDIHIHAPEAAVPKDGPSAGITMFTALVSAFCDIPVRNDIAMTGEITLRGRVLAIGGLREKAMAAYKSGIKTVFIPIDNIPNLEDVDNIVKENVKFIPVKTVDEVMLGALTSMPIKYADAKQQKYNITEKYNEVKSTSVVN